MRLYDKNCDVNNLSPLNLAFVGDTVFDLFVREKLVCEANRPFISFIKVQQVW